MNFEALRVPRDDLSLSAEAYCIEGESKALEKWRGKRGSIDHFLALRLARSCETSNSLSGCA